MRGKIIIFSAPSGAGKTTIVQHLLKQNLGLEFSVSACSREKRKNEKDGMDYHFLSSDEFKKKIEKNEFVEWEEVYPNQYYGTLKTEVERITGKGNHVVFDVDVVGGLNIKKHYGKHALSIFVMPPSIEHLKERLSRRSSETPETLRKRIAKANKEINAAEQFDEILLNYDLGEALVNAEKLVRGFLDN
ncbi:MAG: guanylate kinase [Bacteroidota bacterium]